MSGLESIALAVAHLEKQRREQQKQAATDSSSSDEQPKQVLNKISSSPPPPRSFSGVSKAARVVSSESISDYDTATNNSSAPAESSSPSLNRILQDPGSWLNAHEGAAPISPPKGIVSQISEHDVLCGRGGETNHHQGNIYYRNLVKAFQPLYIASKRRDKPRIAQCIVFTVRTQGGRFLKRTDARSSTWTDVGNTKAREKTSQALREGAPELRGGNATNTTGTVEKQQPPSPVTMSMTPNTLLTPQHHHHHPHVHHLPPLTHHHHPILTPLQQAMSRTFLNTAAAAASIPIVSPTNSFYNALEAQTRKRCFPPIALVSDADYDTPSDASAGTRSSPVHSTNGGPRLKRLKLRCEHSA